MAKADSSGSGDGLQARMTPDQIRRTVESMKGLSPVEREKLLSLALRGNPGAMLVVSSRWHGRRARPEYGIPAQAGVEGGGA